MIINNRGIFSYKETLYYSYAAQLMAPDLNANLVEVVKYMEMST